MLIFARKVRTHSIASLWLVLLLPLLPAASHSASEELYLHHVQYLASPEMKGRGAGTPELNEAAEYIADVFRETGLTPAAGGETYLQPLEITTGARMGPENSLQVIRKRGTQDLKPTEDFIPINFSSSGKVEGEVVFAGYGISAAEFDYDDYTHLDVEGKIVLVLRYEPDFFADPEQQGEGKKPRRYTRHSNLISKSIQARNHGAKAVILVNGQSRGQRADRLIQFGTISGPKDAGIPMVQVRRKTVEQWLRGSNRSLRLLMRDISVSEKPQSFPFASSFKLRLSVDVEQERATVSNVAGYLPGTSDEYIVVGAHYDHLGLGENHSLAPSKIGNVHHGADDNASGVAAVLELAREFGSRKSPPSRGLLFLAFAGEEIGLLGSSHWVENPTLPLENAVAMFNLDMVGRIENRKLYVGGVGTADPFEDLVKQAAQHSRFEIDASRSGYSSSDHTSFSGKKIPVLFFFSGLHGDYHKPSDTADKIHATEAVELVQMVAGLMNEISTMDERPEFVAQSETPGSHQGSPADGGGGGYGPWFGSVPDFAEIPDGVRFADIRPGSPAEKAGLLSGDILMRWNGKPIQNLYDFTHELRESAVGDQVSVMVLRDGKELKVNVRLVARQ